MPAKPLLTVEECATHTTVSISLIYGALRSKKLRGYRLGVRGRGTWRVAPDDLELWLASMKVSELVTEGPPPKPKLRPTAIKHLSID